MGITTHNDSPLVPNKIWESIKLENYHLGARPYLMRPFAHKEIKKWQSFHFCAEMAKQS
jgi:hypothetical protein